MVIINFTCNFDLCKLLFQNPLLPRGSSLWLLLEQFTVYEWGEKSSKNLRACVLKTRPQLQQNLQSPQFFVCFLIVKRTYNLMPRGVKLLSFLKRSPHQPKKRHQRITKVRTCKTKTPPLQTEWLSHPM